MSALRIFTIVFLVSNTLACISQTEFEYPDFDIKLFPESPGVCPTSPTKVTCIQDFNSYKWQLNTQSQTEILTGKSVSITSPGVYTLTVEKEVNSILCSEEFEFIVHDLSDPIQIEKYLQGNGFYSIPIFVNQPTSVGDKINSLRQSCDFLPFRFSNDFDYMDSEDIEVIIQEQFQTFNAFYPLTDLNYISTTNDCFCDEGISNLETDFNSLGGRFWVHSYLQDVEDEQGKLYLKSHNSFVGDIPIDKEHENHLKEISNLIIDDDLNNSDIAKATLKHFEVIFKNTSIGKPFNNYNDIPKCVHQSDIYITPTSLIAELQPDFYDPVFSFGNDELIEGSLIKFSKNNKHYRGYKVGGNKFLGYYNEVNGTIEKNLLYPSTLDNLLNITIPYFCEEECQHEKIDLDFSGVTLSGDGGILLPIQSNILDARFEISFAETKEWFLSLVQHYKGKEQDVFGNLSFTYPQFFEGKHILVKDVYLGNQHYDFIGILFPDFNNTANTFAINEVVKDFGEGYGDYNNALIFDFVPDIRITCFKDLNNNCKRTRPSYIVNYENPGTLIATQSDIQNSNLQNYLNYESDNLLLFVNGYRMNLNLLNDYDRIPYGSIEFNNTYKYAGFCQDSGTYWDELSRLFVDRIGEENAIFIDGHNSINTSNHNDSEDTYKSKLKFASSLYQSICSMPDGVNNNVGLELIDELLEAQTCKGCNEPLPNKCLPLNASPNEQGYTIRFDEGYNDGLLLWDDIASGKVDLKLENGKISGKIDIVAHSMGYAHAMGVVEALKTHLPEGSTLGRFYVIAPENGCSSSIDLSLFEEVWQYGTYGQDEIPPNDNITKVYHLDGVAPQCAVPGLSFDVTLLNNEGIPAYGRIPFNGETKHENFVDAHLGKNQEWILEIKNLKNGHVKNRN